jgi:hypothetical protein
MAASPKKRNTEARIIMTSFVELIDLAVSWTKPKRE